MCEKIRKILADQVQSAFTDTEYPGDEHIVHDTHSQYSDVQETFVSFKRKHWSELTSDIVMLNMSHISFFTVPAFRFYLPAYLHAIATHSGAGDVDLLLDNVFYFLTPPEAEGETHENFLSRVAGFTFPQKETIRTLISLFICVTYGSYGKTVYQSDSSLMRAIRFWDYEEDTL